MTNANITPRAMIGDIPVYCSHDEIADIMSVVPNPRNPNNHPDRQLKLLSQIIKSQGWRKPITVSTRSGYVVSGHGRLQAAFQLGLDKVPVDYQNYESEAAEHADLVADNRIAELAETDDELLAELLKEIEADLPLELAGFSDDEFAEFMSDISDIDDISPLQEDAKGSLKERFIIPPFSILDSRSGEWQNRKKAWKHLGINSDIGRGNDGDKTQRGLTYAVSCQPPNVLKEKGEYEEKIGRKLSWAEYAEMFPEKLQMSGTSIFDPVVCELFYRWLCPSDGKIIDPFAGGSVRGIVAALLGRKYTGCDLSARQIEANKQNWEEIDHQIIAGEQQGETATDPTWINADSRTIDTVVDGEFDLMFTCPPYADLEVYSDDPRDISNMEYPQFLEIYREIIQKTTSKLRKDAFAVCIVGEVRGKDGNYYNFVGDTITAFMDAGLNYYNEYILVNSFGSAAMRASNQFKNSRKCAKVHQNVLVFVKGEPKNIVPALPVIEDEEDVLLQYASEDEQEVM